MQEGKNRNSYNEEEKGICDGVSFSIKLHAHKLKLNKIDPLAKVFSHEFCKIHAFFISNAMLKLAKNQANAKKQPEAKLLLTHILHPLYHPKMTVHILQNKQKKKHVCKNEDENERWIT